MSTNDKAGQLAGIYAQALFELAERSQMVDTVKDDLDALMDLHTQSKDFVAIIQSPYFVDEYKKDLLYKLFSGRLSELTINFLMVAAEHNRTMFLPQIIARYSELWEIYHGYRRVKVTVPKPMKDDEIEGLRKDISAMLNSKTMLELAVNPSIIGGIVIRYDNKVIDNTVKNRLQLAVKMITNRGKVNEI